MDGLYLDLLGVAVLFSTLFTCFLLSLPSRFQGVGHDPVSKKRSKSSVQIVVLGDIGRSPRMQYHALSIAKHGGRVDIIGIKESQVHPQISSSPLIRILPINTSPSFLQTTNRRLVLVYAPLKALYQALSLYYALGYATSPSQYILLQNPPSIPTFFICTVVGFLRNSKLIIDWHNFGYSIYALKLGSRHPLVRLHEWYEFSLGKWADIHITVTQAMAEELSRRGIRGALPLHDRPTEIFQPVRSAKERESRLSWLQETNATQVDEIIQKNARLIFSSTSWTPDEDFSILLDALVLYCSSYSSHKSLSKLCVVITGKGPLQAQCLNTIKQLTDAGKLNPGLVTIITTFFPTIDDYANALSAADFGISLHTSSSGLDLPMKVVDMFGVGIPVVGCSFPAWSELVREGVDGYGFTGGAGDLVKIIKRLVQDDGLDLDKLVAGAREQSERRWDQEWDSVAGRIMFGENLKS